MSYAGYSVMHVSSSSPLILPSRYLIPPSLCHRTGRNGGGTVTPSHLTSKCKTDSGVKDAKMPGVRHESSILICLGSGMLRHEVVADSRVLRLFRKMLYLSTTQVFM